MCAFLQCFKELRENWKFVEALREAARAPPLRKELRAPLGAGRRLGDFSRLLKASDFPESLLQDAEGSINLSDAFRLLKAAKSSRNASEVG
jgi:hypothetical protein